MFISSFKKILLQIFLMCAALLLLLVPINHFYLIRDKCDNDRTQKFAEIEQDIYISNVGSSHGLYGFDYENLGRKYTCFNFALESQKLSYDYRIIECYEDNLAAKGIMFVPVSFFSLYGQDETEQENFEGKNKRYYKFLKPSYIKKYSLWADILYHWFPVINSNTDLLKTMIQGKDTSEAHKNAWYQKATEIDLENDALSAYQRHYVDNNNIIKTKAINAEEYNALLAIIQFCRNKNITPILITVPVTEAYKSKIADVFLDDFYTKINEISERTGTAYYDYSDDVRIITDLNNFMNADHLNRTGAKKFTDILYEDIICKMIIE